MRTVVQVGPEDARVVVVGDAPSQDELDSGMAFSGRLGDVVRDVLAHTGTATSKALFINCVSYRKYGSAPLTAKEIQEDAREYLIPIINSKPRDVIIVLGNNAVCAAGLTDTPAGVNGLRGRLLKSAYFECPLVASIHPYFVLQKPDEVDDFYSDLKFANRISRGDTAEQIPILIEDLESPQAVSDMLEETINQYPFLAYDYETDDKERDTAQVVTAAFCNNKQVDGKEVAYFWGGYDMLKPRFEQHVLSQFKEAFDELYARAGKDYALIAWNMGFDDWIGEGFVGHKIETGSTYDAMILKWCDNNGGRNGLKDATARILGYPDYEAPAYEHFKAVKTRRGRILTEQLDLDVLARYGKEPEMSKTNRPKWPANVDKGLCGYALIPYDILRYYNCCDAVYTRKTFEYLFSRVKKENLGKSYNLRHKIAKELMRCEQRGFLVDQETNRKFSKELEVIIEDCEQQIQGLAVKLDPAMVNFNPGSGPQLSKLLFGAPCPIPVLDRNALYQTNNRREMWAMDKEFDTFENKFYGNLSKVGEAYKDSSFDYVACAERLVVKFLKEFPRYKQMKQYSTKGVYEGTYCPTWSVLTQTKQVYPLGKYKPVAFSKKTGAPSTAGVVLQSLYQDNPDDLITLILMQRKASKIKSTFIDAIYNLMDKDGILHPRMNVIGTNTGRISSSRPCSQNFISYIRGTLIPRPGYIFVNFDLSQAEIRALAALADDDKLMEALANGDIHTNVARQIFNTQTVTKEQRRASKTVVFGIVYGIGSDKLALALGITKEEAQEFIDMFLVAFPKTQAWIENQKLTCAQPPYYAYTPWGTRRSTRGLLSIDPKVRSHTERVACVDEHTEILTSKGWRKYSEVNVGDLVLGKNQKSGLLTWQPVVSMNVYPDYVGDVYHINSRSFSAVCNPEHRWLVYSKATGKDEVRMTSNLSVYGDHRIHRCGIYKGIDGADRPWTDSEVELIGWILTDGYYRARCKSISIYQWKPTGIQEIEGVLKRWGGVYTSRTNTRSPSSIPCNYTEGKEYGLCTELCTRIRGALPGRKLSAEFLYTLSERQLQLLFDAMMGGDGSIGKPTSENDRGKQIFTCRDEDVADAFQMLLTLTGRAGNKLWHKYPKPANNGSTGCWYVNIYRRTRVQVQKKDIQIKQEQRLLWCPTTKDGTFVARRDGKTYITGNSNMPVQGAAGELTLYYIVKLMEEIRLEAWDVWLVNTTHDSVTLEVPLALAWKENEKTELDDTGKPVYTYTPAGPVVDMIERLIATPVPIEPLNKVQFKADLEIDEYWYGKPDLKKALDPRGDIFRWDLLKPEEVLSGLEQFELEELVIS